MHKVVAVFGKRVGMNILLIDDEPDILRHMKKALQILGHTCDAFEDSRVALNNFNKEKYDVVISDVLMPVLNGFAIAEKIRHIAPAVRILLISGCSDKTLEDMAGRYNPEVCLKKPVDIRTMKLVLDNMARELTVDNRRDCTSPEVKSNEGRGTI